MFNRPMPVIINAAHELIDKLLLTDVTVFDVETSLEKCCAGWDEADRTAVLRLAVEFADIRGNALCMAEDVTRSETLAAMEHFLFVAYELGGHLDLPVVHVWTEEDREQSILRRYANPLNHQDLFTYRNVIDFPASSSPNTESH